MAYDKTEPADTTKIRNLGSVLRDNFAAMIEGAVSYKPTAVNLSNTSTPSATANLYKIYSKDVSSKAELHGKDESGNPIQFTTAGKLGNTSLNVLANSISYDNSYENKQDSHCSAWGVSSNGTSLATGFKIASISATANIYTCTFSPALSDANYAVVITKFDPTTNDSRIPIIRTKSAASFTYEFRDKDTAPTTIGHMLLVFGGR